MDLKGRSLLTIKDYSQEEIRYLLDLSHQLKKESREKKINQRFLGKSIALLFEKRSTRTRCAFETSIGEEGGHPVFLSQSDIHLGVKEDLEDTARVLGRMFSAIMFRGYKQSTAETLMKFSGVPVYNGLTDEYHPTQALADLMTIEEKFGTLKNLKCVYVGDGRNNVARSLMIACAKMGTHCTILAPKELYLDDESLKECLFIARESGAEVSITSDFKQALDKADIIYTDVWISMGEEAQKTERIKHLSPFQVNQKLMDSTGKMNTVFLHCLPAVKGQEVTKDVLDGPRSLAWEQAENRKHTIKAVMLATIE
ncbi:MAG: ornithine carbamoyltransferase [Spirochaetales bacterium]|nr:ornithine carbamoyltransferase [Spirochaetales bacterium]